MHKKLGIILLMSILLIGCNHLTIGEQYRNLQYSDSMEGLYAQIINSKTKKINQIYKLQKIKNKWTISRIKNKKFIPIVSHNLNDNVHEYNKTQISSIFNKNISVNNSRCIGHSRYVICKYFNVIDKQYHTSVLALNKEGKPLIGLKLYKKSFNELKSLGF